MSCSSKILIVDDDVQVRGTLNRFLSKEGYETRGCATGKEAIEMLEQEKVDLILLDMVLPDMGGCQVIQHMRRSGLEAPVILITGYASTDSAIQAFRSGVYDYIRKPFEREEIIRTTKKAIEFKKMKEGVAEANQSLREKEHYYRSLMTSLHEDIVVINRDYQITDINHEFLLTTGYGREEVIGRPCYEVLQRRPNPCFEEAEDCLVDKVFKTGVPARGYYHGIGGQNPLITADILVSPLHDGEGRVTHVIEAIRDITDLVTVQGELDRAEESWEVLVESSPDAILILDTKKAIVSYNKAFLDLFGYERGEPDGQPISALSEERFHDFTSDAEASFKSEWEMRRKDKTIFPVDASFSAFRNPDGSIRGYVAILRDITERRMIEQKKARLQSALQQTQRLESLGRLAGGIAHDFNNILQNLVGYADQAFVKLPEGSPSAHYLNKVLEAARRAGEVVDQIRAFSRQTSLERQPLQLIPVIEKTMKLLRSSLPSRVEIRMVLPPGSSRVFANEDQIRQVLITLCLNSAQAIHFEPGILEVRLDEIHMGSKHELVVADLRGVHYVRLTIEDSGQSVDPRTLQGLFDPMSAAVEADMSRGLGLWVVHGIVASLGGTVTASSNPGKGNAFVVYLPTVEGGAC